jgi:hypothetical protein
VLVKFRLLAATAALCLSIMAAAWMRLVIDSDASSIDAGTFDTITVQP